MSWLLAVILAADGPALRRTFVDFVGPAECPTVAVFEEQLTRRTDVVSLVPRSEASALISITLTRAGKRFTGTARLRLDDGTTTSRTLSGNRCDTLVQALALASALVLDPEHAKTGALDSPMPTAEPTEPAALTQPPALEPPVEKAPEVVVTTPEPAPSPPRSLELLVLAEGGAANNVSATFDLGAGARAQLYLGNQEGRWRAVLGLGAGGLSGRLVESVNGRARYAPRFVGELEAGAGLGWRWLHLALTVAARLEPLFVEGLDGDVTSSALRALVSVGPALSLAFGFHDVQLGVRASVPVSLRQERYLIEPRGEVFSVPSLGLTVSLVAGWRFG